MKLTEEFVVAGTVEEVWRFFEQPQAVAGCMPGVEDVRVVDDDHVQVLATQSIGPMTATFEAQVAVLERVPHDLIRFRATGRSVRGAVGSLRADNAVRLRASPDGTTVSVEGEVALAGALGSVGQKVVARQAKKVTAQFAGNLQRALNGETVRAPVGVATTGAPTDGRRATWPAERPAMEHASAPATRGSAPATRGSAQRSAWRTPRLEGDAWSKAATVLSALSLAVGIATWWRQRSVGR